LLLPNYGKEGRPSIVSVTLSQETLAEMIGTTRSRVSFFMNKFRKLGFIDCNGTIHVYQSLLNAVPRQAGDQGRVRTSKSWSSLNIGLTLFETGALSRISSPRRLKLALASE
jgi:hypothetical protein